MKSYAEEFSRIYEQPRVDRLIVGFSGIDPPKRQADAEVLSTGQESEVKSLIEERVRAIQIVCDCGEIGSSERADSEPSPLESTDMLTTEEVSKVRQLLERISSGADEDETIDCGEIE